MTLEEQNVAARPLHHYLIAGPTGAVRVRTILTLEELNRQINHGAKSFLLDWVDAAGEARPLVVVVAGIISIEPAAEAAQRIVVGKAAP